MRKRLGRSRVCALLCGALCFAPARAGGYASSSFTAESLSTANLVTKADSVILDIDFWTTTKLYGDASPATGGARTYAPGVAAHAIDTFSFFWAKETGGDHEVYQLPGHLTEIQFVPGTVRKLFGNAEADISYLSAAASGDHFACTFVDRNNNGLLRAANDGGVIEIWDQISYSPYSSMCHYKADTFLVVHRIQNRVIRIVKLLANSTQRQVLEFDTLGRGTVADDIVTNSSVAYDGDGMILGLFLRGSGWSAKKLEYKVTTESFATIDSGVLANNVSDNNAATYFPDAPCVGYAPGKFAAAHWNNGGVYLDTITVVGGVAQTEVIPLAAGAGYRAATVAANEHYLTVAWKGNMNGHASPSVEGIRYRIIDGAISFADPDTFTFSDSSVSVDMTTPELAIAMDPQGSTAFAWTHGNEIHGAIWATRGMRYASGSWISAVQSITRQPGDSVMFLSATVTKTSVGSTGDSVRVGTHPTQINAWTDWISLSDATELREGTRSEASYFQYKTHLYRDGNPIRTPAVKGFSFTWNLQPRVTVVDSLLVNGVRQPGVAFGSSVTVYSRIDPIDLYFQVHDGDGSDAVSGAVDWLSPIAFNASGAADKLASVRLDPAPVSDSVYVCTITAQDQHGWAAPARSLTVATVNDIPDLRARVAYDPPDGGAQDTVRVLSTVPLISLQESDSAIFLYSVEDYNDPAIMARVTFDGGLLDQTMQGAQGRYKLEAATLSAGTDTIVVSARDEDAETVRTVALRSNRPPVITALQIDGETVSDGQTVRTTPGAVATVTVTAQDPNVGHWDVLRYRFVTETFDSTQAASVFTFAPSRGDTTLRVYVYDSFDKTDMRSVTMIYPWYAADSLENPGYFEVRARLAEERSYVVGAMERDTLRLPIINTGSSDLTVWPFRLKAVDTAWRRIGLPRGNDTVWYDSLTTDSAADAITLVPGDTARILFAFDANTLSGDGIVRDSLFIGANDPVHPRDTIPVLLEYNTLPTIVSVSFDYAADTPYWLAKRRAAAAAGYEFPPHARLAITFSEPMDSASAFDGLRVYSVLDSLATGAKSPFTLTQSWDAGFETVYISPEYPGPSAHFAGLRPPAGVFIPTDSIAIEFSSNLTDQAQTPSGPNGLDIDNDYERDTDETTLRAVRVDSAQLELLWTAPRADETGVAAGARIELRFSAPILPGTIDTSLENNRTLLLTSRYLSHRDHGRRVAFDSVYIEGARAVFVPNRRFFHDDSVYCYYRGLWARDSLGYSVDIDRDGVPMHLFDSAATEDDYTWRFFIETVNQDSVYPPPGARGVSMNAAIRIMFRDAIQPDLLDRSLTGNRSLVVRSRYSGGSQIGFRAIEVDSAAATFTLERRLFYGDSVHCVYSGLYADDTTAYAIDIGDQRFVTTRDDREWSFYVEELELVDISPDSASAGAPIHADISMTFSGPVSPLLFDTSTNADNNVSFRFLSTSAENGVSAIERIAISPDSATVTISPARTFFSGDSVACMFTGFSNAFRYAEPGPFLPADPGAAHGSYQWHFFTEDVRFYTYPNPYKPGGDRRHREVGGVWFKNLHALKRGMTDAIVRVYNMNTHPVFDSQEAGARIHFVRGDPERRPEWLWRAVNTRGAPLASGVYLYAVFDEKAPGKALVKGKVLLVR